MEGKTSVIIQPDMNGGICNPALELSETNSDDKISVIIQPDMNGGICNPALELSETNNDLCNDQVIESKTNESYYNPTIEVEHIQNQRVEKIEKIKNEEVVDNSQDLPISFGPGFQNSSVRHRSVQPISLDVENKNDTTEWSAAFMKARFQGIKEKAPKKLKSYYKGQEELIDSYVQYSAGKFCEENAEESEQKKRKSANILAKITVLINILLVSAQAVAVYLSGSLSIISSLVDSSLDLASGVIIWYAGRQIQIRSPYLYPQGRTRMEPVSLIILSVLMGLAAAQLIIQSIQMMIEGKMNPQITIPTLVISLCNIGIKLVMFLICRKIDNSSVQALAQDHRNDMLLNTVALCAGYIGYRLWVYADPIGAMLIGLYIVFNWWRTGKEQVRYLIGYTANSIFLQQLTYVSMHHSEKIKQIDTVRAFHFGNNFIVEVDIVLPEEMILREAHDIGETLQQKIESMPGVERAFVHLDYEIRHNPGTEHKIV